MRSRRRVRVRVRVRLRVGVRVRVRVSPKVEMRTGVGNNNGAAQGQRRVRRYSILQDGARITLMSSKHGSGARAQGNGLRWW